MPQVKNIDDPLFKSAYKLYQNSFPQYEQRPLNQINASLFHPDFVFDVGEGAAYLLGTWHTPDFIFVEHFAVHPDLRGKGIGRDLLAQLAMQAKVPIILEIDPIEDDVSRRRLAFYEKAGYKANPQFKYIHPPYEEAFDSFPLLVMSYPDPMDDALYQKFVEYRNTQVLAVGKERQTTESKNSMDVAMGFLLGMDILSDLRD